MKINDLYEATWLGHQAKRLGTKYASKIVPKALGGAKLTGMAYVRKRTSDLMNSWKELEGMGTKPNIVEINKWLTSGKNPVNQDQLDYISKNIVDKERNLSNNNLRSYFQKVAGIEAKSKEKFSPQDTGDVTKGTTQTPSGRITGIEDTVQDLAGRVDDINKKLDFIFSASEDDRE